MRTTEHRLDVYKKTLELLKTKKRLFDLTQNYICLVIPAVEKRLNTEQAIELFSDTNFFYRNTCILFPELLSYFTYNQKTMITKHYYCFKEIEVLYNESMYRDDVETWRITVLEQIIYKMELVNQQNNQ